MLHSFRLKYHGFSKFIIKFLLEIEILHFLSFPLLINYYSLMYRPYP